MSRVSARPRPVAKGYLMHRHCCNSVAARLILQHVSWLSKLRLIPHMPECNSLRKLLTLAATPRT